MAIKKQIVIKAKKPIFPWNTKKSQPKSDTT